MRKPLFSLVFVVSWVVAFAGVPLFASVPLSTILDRAKQNNQTLKSYQLTLENTTLAQRITDADDEVSVTVESGTLGYSYDSSSSSHVYTLDSAGVSVEIPHTDNGSTNLSLSSGLVSYEKGTSDTVTAKPTIAYDQSFVFGYRGDERLKLLRSQNNLSSAERSYQESVLTYENSLLSIISSLLGNAQSIVETNYNLKTTKQDIDSAVTLRTLDPTSLAYTAKMNAYAVLEHSLSALKLQGDIYRSQYQTYVGSSWDDVSDIPVATLAFTPDPVGNTSVLLKKYAFDIAEENLRVKQASLTNSRLDTKAGASFSTTNKGGVTTSNAVGGTVSASYHAPTYSLTGGVSYSYNTVTGQSTPTLFIGGSWNNNTTAKVDKLAVQEMENTVLLAQIEYGDALTSYMKSSVEIEKSVADWALTYASAVATVDYDRQLVEQKQGLYSAGLIALSELEKAQMTEESDRYSLEICLLNGLVIANKIKIMEL